MVRTAVEPVYTVSEVAEMLRISVYSIREKLKSGELEGFKIGTKWRIPQRAIDDLKNRRG